MIIILKFLEYNKNFSSQIVQSIKEYVHEFFGHLISSLKKLFSDFLEEEFRICVLNPDIRVLQRNLFEAQSLRKPKKVLGHQIHSLFIEGFQKHGNQVFFSEIVGLKHVNDRLELEQEVEPRKIDFFQIGVRDLRIDEMP